MWRTVSFACVAAGFLALIPAQTSAQKKQPLEVADLATEQDYKALQTVKEMDGKLASVNTMSVTFRLDIPHMVPNPKYRPPKGNNQNQQMQNIYRQQAAVMATTNPVQRQIKMQQLMNSMQKQQYQQMAKTNGNPNNQPFMLDHQYKDFDLDLSEKIVVRKMFLETEYDDKGNLKTYTKEELKELKGKDSTKPGYTAKIEDLQAAQHVHIHLKMPKKAKPASESEKEKAADKDKAVDKDKAIDKDKAADKEKAAADKDKAAEKKVVDKADQVIDPAKKTDKADDKGTTKEKAEVVKPIITMIVILDKLDSGLSNSDAPPKKKKAN